MKRFIYLSLLLLLSFSLSAQAIYNVRISQEGERIVLLYDVAEDIVDTLNEEDEGGNWYVGAKDEEYVYVD